MKKIAVVLMVLLAILIVAPASFAQAGAAAEKPPINPTALIIAAGFAWPSQRSGERSARSDRLVSVRRHCAQSGSCG